MIMKHRIAIWSAAAELYTKVKKVASDNANEKSRQLSEARKDVETTESGTDERIRAEGARDTAYKLNKKANKIANAIDNMDIHDPYE